MTDLPGSAAWLRTQTHALLDFGLRSISPLGGFGWLDDDGNIDHSRGRELLVTARMTHVFALGTLLGHPGCREALRHGLAALTGPFHDEVYGGWYSHLDDDGSVDNDSKGGYDHSFVILAASSSVAAGEEAAWPLLRDALEISATRFWDDHDGMVVERWNREFTRLDPYRGVNANMHTVEAYLAAADALDLPGNHQHTGEIWREKVARIIDRVINREARANNWRIPEHFDSQWNPVLDFNADHPADQFRPYGATIGHGLEWTRLCLQADASLPSPPAWLREAAQQLYLRAVADGWAADGEDGFVYTTDWDGKPVVHERMWWVVTEAIGASNALRKAGVHGNAPDVEADLQRWWNYAERYLIDHDRGSWHHELDRHNHPSALVWPGKSDIYHALQATLLPSLPIAPAIGIALAQQ